MSATDPTNTNATASSSTSPESDASKAPKRVVYQVETTGSYWNDVKEAVKRISVRDDLSHINEIPCARNSLLSGIASGVGIGFIRGMSGSVFLACNWAVGTFMLISLGSWTICQRNREEERRRLQQVMEAIPKRFVKKDDEGAPSNEQKSA
ncbi:hypothetical protein PYCCODRAFT_1463703 [Trametes coccinea BRFM310]|uniref:Cytochrome c oxidase assembly protein COX20, mitochondrial n=1 Tax=Trametes coccinea (strain BRFM310) TaxID=1353009 RepID=A0A1Y2J298_TRAC3|nr:hypothetical protein PYCCODRAFT_1463703 [Trametes coccinea BRFM310]